MRGSGSGAAAVAGSGLEKVSEVVAGGAQALVTNNPRTSDSLADDFIRTPLLVDLRVLSSRPAQRDNGQPDEHAPHARDLGELVRLNVGRELEYRLVLCGGLLSEQLLHHGHCPSVVLYHVHKEDAIESRSPLLRPAYVSARWLACLACGERTQRRAP